MNNKNAKPKAIIFDLDGTIVNSMEAFARIAARVIQRHYDVGALEARSLYLMSSGIPFFQQLEQLFPKDPANGKAAQEFEEEKKRGYFAEPLFDDTAETVGFLRGFGIKAVVSSNNFQTLVDEYVRRSGVAFDLVLGFKENFAKGAEHFRFIEKELGVTKEEMVFVGDSLKDGERAENYGVKFVAKEGIFTREEFQKKIPNAEVITKLKELKELLCKS